MPCMPSSAPEIGAPTTVETGTATMKDAAIAARYFAGNQKVR